MSKSCVVWADPCRTMATPPITTSSTRPPLSASTRRWKSVTTRRPGGLEGEEELPHTFDSLSGSESQPVLDLRHVDTRRDLLEDLVRPGALHHGPTLPAHHTRGA